MNIFSTLYYSRKRGEKLSSYICRIILAYTVFFLIIGIPFIMLLAFLYDEPIIDFTISHGIPSYIGGIVGASIALILRDWFLNRRKEKPIDPNPLKKPDG